MVKAYIKSLSPRSEFVIVVAVAFGYFIATSILAVLYQPAEGRAHHSVISLIVLVLSECALIGMLSWFLTLRGWTLRKVGLRPTLRDTAVGIALAATAYIVWVVTWNVTARLAPEVAWTMYRTSGKIVPHAIPLIVSLAVAVVNPIFEELFVSGYVISALREKRSAWFAINTSVAIRLLYHLYQGILGVLSIIPIGLIFAGWYVRSSKLWPLIVAHAILDLAALLTYSKL